MMNMARKILQPGRNCEGIYEVTRTGLLIDGRNYYRAFYETARQAQRYILMAGWQFERSVKLLRGPEEEAAGRDVRMAPFLNALCERNLALEIYILMWDFSALVSFDKEWFNKLVFDLGANPRIHFRFDSRHALYASHHQKLVVIDGIAAFVGGLDFAANSWDDRKHWSEDAERVLAGEQYEPYHDVQSFHTGPAAWKLTNLFQKRWLYSGGGDLALAPPRESFPVPVRKLVPIAARTIAVSVTRAQTLLPVLDPVMHIRQLYIDAIDAAEKLIYIENQYFSSQAVYEAIKRRLTDNARPCPEIVMVLPRRFHTLVEDISLSAVQARMLRSLNETARARGRPFGVYFTAAGLRAQGPGKPTYIHSKVLVVDDRLLSVGSANITNRSMGMDTELNVSWEADLPEGDEPVRSIRRVRANLLAEHTGLRRLSERRLLGSVSGLVRYLDSKADLSGCRLRKHIMESFLDDIGWMKQVVAEDISIDPERPVVEEGIYEVISRDKDSIFSKGILFLNELARQPSVQADEQLLEVPVPPTRPWPFRTLRISRRSAWYILAAIAFLIGILAVFLWLSGPK